MSDPVPAPIPAVLATGEASASVQAVPAALDELLALHGTEPDRDSGVRLRSPLLASLVGNAQIALGMAAALIAYLVAGTTAPMLFAAFGWGMASAAGVIALRRHGRVRSADLAISAVLCAGLAITAGIGTGVPLLGMLDTAYVALGILIAGLQLAMYGMHAGGWLARLGRIAAPLVPLAGMLAVAR